MPRKAGGDIGGGATGGSDAAATASWLRPMRRFSGHLLRLALAVALPLVLLSAALVAWTAEGQRADALRDLESTTLALQLAVDQEIGLTVAMLEALATSPAVDAALLEGGGGAGAASVHAQASALVALRPAALAVIWLRPADGGAPIMTTLLPPGTPPPMLPEPRFPPRAVGPAPTSSYQAVIEQGRLHVGDLVQGAVPGWTVLVALPVRRAGRLVGVLGAGLRPSSLGQVMRAQLPDEAGVAVLMDRGAIVVGRTVQEDRFIGLPAGAAGNAFQQQANPAPAMVPGQMLEGTPVYAAFRRLTMAPFAVGYGAPRVVVDAPLRRALTAAAIGGVLALLLAAGAALWFGRRLGGAVAALGEDALLIAAGHAVPPRAASRVIEVEAARAALLRSTAALAESDARFTRAVAAARIGTWEWDAAANRLTGSPGREALYGRAPGSMPTREAMIEAVHPDDRAIVSAAADAALRGEAEGHYRAEFRTVWPDGTIRWLSTQGRAELAPDGTALRMSGAVVDVTLRREAEAALRDSERRLRLAQDAAGIGVWERDLVTGGTTWSEQEYRLHGLDPGQPPPDAEALRAMTLPEDRAGGLLFERLRDAGVASEEHGKALDAEYRIRRADTGDIRWLQVFGRALPGPDGRPARVIGVSLDVTERREAEERQVLLMREVDHRAKNALAVALSVVQLAPQNVSPQSFAAGVAGRIAAMSRAHSLLAAERWAGADLGDLIEGELAVHAGHFSLEGPHLRLVAAAAQPVTMLLHELATNAAKHGALACPGGRLALSWEVDQSDGLAVRLLWREQGGPRLAGPPVHAGFGSRLLASLARQQLGGSVRLDWSDPAGLTVTLRIPWRHVAWYAPAGTARKGPQPAARRAPSELPLAPPGRPPRVLLVEDEALLAMQTEAWLQSLGCEVVGPARDLAQALRHATEEPELSAAVLDVNLGPDESALPVVDVLRARGIPFIFATGYAGPAALEGRGAVAVAVLRKPFGRPALADALARALAPAAAPMRRR